MLRARAVHLYSLNKGTLGRSTVSADGRIWIVGLTSKSSRSTIRDLLIAVINDPDAAADQLRSLDATCLEMVLEYGMAQKLSTAIVACLRSASLPVPDWLEAHRFKVAARRAVIEAGLARIAPAMNDSGIPWAVLKGPVTASSFSSPHLREFGDLDILVEGLDLADVLDVFAGVGIDDLNHNWEPYARYGVAEFPVIVGGAPIDLHWHLIGLSSVRQRFTVSIDQILDRRRSVSLGGVDCYRLDAEDHLGHVALHAGLSGAGNLGQLRDVHETVRANEIDWDEFMVRTKLHGVAPLVGHVLDRCVSVLGSPVPTSVIANLTPGSTLVARRWLDGRGHPWGDPSETSYSGLVVSVSRKGVMGTATRAAEMIWERAAGIAGRQPLWSAYDPESPLYWRGGQPGARGFDDYLAYSAREMSR
jgi:hypothetical protein